MQTTTALRLYGKRDLRLETFTLPAMHSCEFVSVDYTKDCMRLRNKRLVELADCCVCFCGEPEGRSGTAQTVRMARQKGIPVINLAS